MFSDSPLFILTLTCLTKDAENVSKMLKPRLEKVPAAPNTIHYYMGTDAEWLFGNLVG